MAPAEWKLTYDGRTISLAPSIGNWSFRCRSHYWIDEGSVRWAAGFSEDEVALVRQEARDRRAGYYQTKRAELTRESPGRDDERGLKRSIRKIFQAVGRAFGRGKE